MEPDKEITAMTKIVATLSALGEDDQEAVKRIVQWIVARYGDPRSSGLQPSPAPPPDPGHEPSDRFEHLADLMDTAAPEVDPDRVLVASYWLTRDDSDTEFIAQDVNTRLKALGYGVKNITQAFATLMKKKPALVIQTAKAGSSRQARKRYKLTVAGRRSVEQMIAERNDT